MAPKSSSGNCCTSSDPPSPDGLAPRPAISFLRTPGKSSAPRHLTPSWSTAISAQIGAELRSIFEDEKSDAGKESPKPRAKLTPMVKSLVRSDKLEVEKTAKTKMKKTRSVKLKAVLEGDLTRTDIVDCHTPQEFDNLTPLGAVKSKLKKVLSLESGISKCRPRASVGTSEEEVERRAELRRIRQKMIQDELSHEDFYDEDAKSSASVVHLNSLLPRKSWKPWLLGDVLPLPELTHPALALPVYAFPALLTPLEQHDHLLQPRVSSLASPPLSPRPRSEGQTYFLTEAKSAVNSCSTVSRRHSSPILTEYDITPASELLVYKPTRKRSSFPPNIQPPIHKLKSNHSVDVPVKSSWRSSFAANNRGEHLRKLSQGKVLPVALDPVRLGVDVQPVRRWLHSQGLRISSQVITDTKDSIYVESSNSKTGSHAPDFGGVGGKGPSLEPPHLHEMGISQRLASHGLYSSSSSPQLSSWGSREQGASSTGPSRRADVDRSRYLYHTSSDSIPLSNLIPRSWGTVLEDGTSSFYPSAVNSANPTPESSRYNLLSLIAGKGNKMDPLPKNSSGLIKALTDPAFLPATGYSTANLIAQPSEHICSQKVDDSSVVLSETESFREIEAELRLMQQRFATTETEQRPSTPRSSKFHEEFQDIETPGASSTCHSSVISRLVKRVTKPFDGSIDMEELLAVPILDVTPGALRHASNFLSPSSVISPLSDDSVFGIWGNAVKLHMDKKTKDVAKNLNIPSSKSAWARAVEKQTEPKAQEVAYNLYIPRVTGQFGKAVQKNNIPRVRHMATNLQIPLGKRRRNGANLSRAASDHSKSQISQDSRGSFSAAFKRTLSFRTSSRSPRLSGPSGFTTEEEAHFAAAAEYEARFRERVAAKEFVLASWEAELDAGARKAKAKSREIIRRTKWKGRDPDDKRFPPSWSRWPSHTRPRRIQSAGREDSVEGRDFAIVGWTEDGEPIWCRKHERKHHLKHHRPEGAEGSGSAGQGIESDEHSHTHSHNHSGDENALSDDSVCSHTSLSRGRSLFRNRSRRQSPSSCRSQKRLQAFEEGFRTALYKFETSGEQGLANQVHGRRSSMNLEGRMKYPELEILPMRAGIVSQMELERSVEGVLMGERRGLMVKMVREGTMSGGLTRDKERGMTGGGGRELGKDGKLDGPDEDGDKDRRNQRELSTSESLTLSIADPRFYEDCVDNSMLLDGDSEEEGELGYGAEALTKSMAFLEEEVEMKGTKIQRMANERERESLETVGVYEDASEVILVGLEEGDGSGRLHNDADDGETIKARSRHGHRKNKFGTWSASAGARQRGGGWGCGSENKHAAEVGDFAEFGVAKEWGGKVGEIVKGNGSRSLGDLAGGAEDTRKEE